METKIAQRKSFQVEAIVVNEENIDEVAAWAGGTVEGEGSDRFVKVSDKNAMNSRQTKAFIGDYVLKLKNSFKTFSEASFKKSFFFPEEGQAKEQKVNRSAKDGKFVSKEEAEANPYTTVTETVVIPSKEEVPNPVIVDTNEKAPIFSNKKDKEVKPPPAVDSKVPDGKPYYEIDSASGEVKYFDGKGLPITKEQYDQLLAVSEIPTENLRMTD